MQIHYLEIVTPDVDKTCRTYGEIYQVEFGEGVVELGNARTAMLENGGIIGVRAPMHETEEPVVRPYFLVTEIEAVLEEVIQAGGEVVHQALEIPGLGKFAIYLQGGIQHGLWQL